LSRLPRFDLVGFSFPEKPIDMPKNPQ